MAATLPLAVPRESDEDVGGFDQKFARLANSGVFTSFLPVKLKQQLIRNQIPGRAELMDGAVLFVDVSGFTALSEKLKRDDEEGAAEELCVRLNSFFKKIISTVYRNGGDVIKFSGDAVTVVFLVGESTNSRQTHGFADVRAATEQAVKTSEALHDTVDEKTAIEDGLSLHMAIGCGRLTGVHVGGAHNRMEFILAGQPMDQISIAESMAAKDETCISPEVYELVKEMCETTLVHELDDDYYMTAHVKSVTEEDKAAERAKRKRNHNEPKARGYRMVTRDQFREWRKQQGTKQDPGTDTGLSLLTLQRCNDHSMESLAALYPVVETMKSFIPGAVVKRLADGQDVDQDGSHLAEMLKLSVIFMSVEGLDLVAKNEGDLKRVKNLAQRFMLKIQESVYGCEGSINKILVDDKGLLCVCALGLPPMYHGDDPVRAVRCAGNLLKNFESLAEKPKAKIGVTTGRAFCGVVGSSMRREYTVMGTTVNLAARLMGEADWGGIMVDENTMKEAKSFEFSNAIMRNLKGIGERKLYSPVFEEKGKKKKSKKSKKKDFNKILNALEWGREDEISLLYAIIRKLCQAKSGVMLLTGERGSGKTFLVEMFDKIAETVGLELLQSNGSKNKEATMPYKDYYMFVKLYQQIGVHDFKPAQPWTMYSAWHEIVIDAVRRGAAAQGVTEKEWITFALESYENGSLAGQAHYLREILPQLDIADTVILNEKLSYSMDLAELANGMAPPSFSPTMLTGDKLIEKVGELLCALLAQYAKSRPLPVLLVLHIQQQTSIVRVNDENWALLMQVGSKPNTIVAAVTRTIENTFEAKEGLQAKDIVQVFNEKTIAEETKLDLHNFDAEFAKKFASDVLSHPDIQNPTGEDRPIYKIAKPDLPPQLSRVLSEVGFGNPKNIVEFLDVLMTGYTNEEDWHTLLIDQNVINNMKDQWHEPAIAVDGHHAIRVIADLEMFPPPAKIVGYVLQAYESLPVHQQYLLKVGSIYEYGFSVEMLRPLIQDERKSKLPKDLEDLVSQQFLNFIKRDDRTAAQWKPIQRLDPEANGVYLFHSRLLLNLIVNRLVKKEREGIEHRMDKVRVKSRWKRIRSHIEEIADSKSRLKSIGFEVMDREIFFNCVNKSDYIELMRTRSGNNWIDMLANMSLLKRASTMDEYRAQQQASIAPTIQELDEQVQFLEAASQVASPDHADTQRLSVELAEVRELRNAVAASKSFPELENVSVVDEHPATSTPYKGLDSVSIVDDMPPGDNSVLELELQSQLEDYESSILEMREELERHKEIESRLEEELANERSATKNEPTNDAPSNLSFVKSSVVAVGLAVVMHVVHNNVPQWFHWWLADTSP